MMLVHQNVGVIMMPNPKRARKTRNREAKAWGKQMKARRSYKRRALNSGLRSLKLWPMIAS